MCRVPDVFNPNELKDLSKKRLDALQEYGKLIVLTNPHIRKLIKNSIKKNPGPGIRKELRALLGPELKRLKSI